MPSASSKPTAKSKSGGQDSSRSKQTGTADSKQSDAPKPHKNAHAGSLLIPPPPPTAPIAGQLSGLTGVPIDFMSQADLERKQKELADQVSAVTKEVQDKEKSADDKRQRSTLFASLYTEGVVSRRELEQSQREDTEAESDLKSSRQKLEEIEHLRSEVDAHLKKLAKRPTGHTSKTSPGRDEKPSPKK